MVGGGGGVNTGVGGGGHQMELGCLVVRPTSF